MKNISITMHPLHCPHILTSLGNLTVTRTGRPDFSQKDGKPVINQHYETKSLFIFTTLILPLKYLQKMKRLWKKPHNLFT